MKLGIDPGINGAIAVLDGEDIKAIYDMPVVETKSGKTMKRSVSPAMLADIIRQYPGAPVTVERVAAMPGQGVASMFNFGKSAGIVEGVCAGLGNPVTLVTPQAWQKRAGRKDGKDGSRARAAELFPLHAKQFAMVKDDGRAEAVLIAKFG